MAGETIPCPTLGHIDNADQCLENFAGLGSTVYVGIKSDLAEKMVLTDNTYAAPKFKAGKGLFKIDCKDDSNKLEGGSLGRRKGFKQTATIVIEAVNKMISKYGRAFNNLDLFFIFPDGEEYQIMYDPTRKVVFDADGIKTDTGAASSDERTTTMSCTLQPVRFSNMYVTVTDIDALLEGYEAPAA